MAQRAAGDVGIGLQAGQPSGLSIGVYQPTGMGLDGLAAWDLDDFFISIHGLFITHIGDFETFYLFYGLGFTAAFFNIFEYFRGEILFMQQPIITPSRQQALKLSLILLAAVVSLCFLFGWLLHLVKDQPWDWADFTRSSLPLLIGVIGAEAANRWWPRRKLKWNPSDLGEGEVIYEKALVYRHWQRSSKQALMVLTNRRLILTDTQNEPWEIPVREVRVLGLRQDWRPGQQKTVLHYQGKNSFWMDGCRRRSCCR